jgi:putative SOS response-associated peptidase YedK
MCGRFVSSNSPDSIASYFDAAVETEELPANYNVAPTNDVYGVVADGDQRAVRAYHWGLVPTWAKDVKIGSKMINARAETIAEKPAFRSLFKKHRILVPMNGFYEWQVVAGEKKKQPMFIHSADGSPLAVAGLWSAWRDKSAGDDAPWLHSCTVITTSANATMAPVHDRMPVFLARERWDEWLDPSHQDVSELTSLLVPAPEELLVMHPVSTEVNSVRNKGPELIEPLDTAA